jgi:hypothetical protein
MGSTTTHRLKFFHGLGDVLMFRNILDVLESPVELYLNPKLGQSALFRNDPRIQVVSQTSNDKSYREIKFYMEHTRPCQSGSATKKRVCLEHEFGLILPELSIRPLPLEGLENLKNEAITATHAFLKGLGPYVVCHFQGTSNPQGQNPEIDFASRSVNRLASAGWGVVIINYDYLYHHPTNADFSFIDNDQIRSTFRQLPMEVESLWTLISGAQAFYGVDSGPLHLALCSSIPCTYIHHRTRFLENFYDSGLENLSVVKTDNETAIPESLIPSHETDPAHKRSNC